MSLRTMAWGEDVISSCECILGYSYAVDDTRERSAVLAIDTAVRLGSSTHISFAKSQTRDTCVHFDLETKPLAFIYAA
ncbi:hypothetical protein LJC63_13085 [Ruminococcaceae bacterium OttesenSCG-928-L11]|nr:hypothetical protein [Ruminococcaceae bacterium OttesenSCG-928-L11]